MARSKKLEVEECGEREVRDGEIIREVDGMGVGEVMEGTREREIFGLLWLVGVFGVSEGRILLELFCELDDKDMGEGDGNAFTE